MDVGVGYVEAARLLSERSAGQCKLNRRLETVLKAVGRLGGESGELLEGDLYRVLNVEYGFNEDEALDLIVELMRAGLVYTPRARDPLMILILSLSDPNIIPHCARASGS